MKTKKQWLEHLNEKFDLLDSFLGSIKHDIQIFIAEGPIQPREHPTWRDGLKVDDLGMHGSTYFVRIYCPHPDCDCFHEYSIHALDGRMALYCVECVTIFYALKDGKDYKYRIEERI